jgi:hypothetical protein
MAMVEFRWVAAIALWTMLSGPVFGPGSRGPSAGFKSRPHKAATASGKVRASGSAKPPPADGGR